jgi:hypothetical protein
MEIVKSVFQSKSKRYQFIRYCTVGTLAGLLSVAGIRNDQLEYCLHDRLCDEFYL